MVGSRPEPDRRPRLRAHALVALAVLGLGLATAESLPTGVWHDDGVYVLQGQALENGEGLGYGGGLQAYAAPKFPPGYPIVVAAVLKLVPGGLTDSMPFGVLNVVLLTLTTLLLGMWAQRVAVTPPHWAPVAVLAAMLPLAVWTVAQVALSETLFLFALTLAILAGQRLAEAGANRLWWPLFLAAAALAFFTRTIGAVVPLAALIAFWGAGRPRAGVLVTLLSASWILPWALWSGRETDAIPAPLRDVLGAYGPWWRDQVQSDPSAYVGHLARNAVAVGRDLAGVVLPGFGGPAWSVLAVVVLVFGLIGARALWGRDRLATLVLTGYVALVWLWPFRAARLVAPIAPLWVFVVFVGAAKAATDRAGVGWRGGLAASVVICSVVLNLSGIFGGRHREGLEARAEALARAVALVRGHTPPGAVVGAPEYWGALTLHTQAQGVPSARFLPLQQDAPSWGSHPQLFELWDTAGIEYLLLEQAGRMQGSALDALEASCPGAVRTVAVEPGLILAGLAWDDDCRSRVMASGTS